MAKEWQDKFARNGDEASHPELVEIQEDLFKKKEEYLKFLDRGKSVPDALGKKMVALQASRTASILSIIIESMPNLQVLETYKLILFHFAKIHCNSETGARFSRPLSGLLNLRILKIGESACSLEMTATHCLWLMLFLPSLTHLKIFTEFCSNDERFFGEHQEVLGGKSQVTHLQIEFDTKREQGRNPFGMPWTKNEVLQSLLMVTKDLVELKLCNLLPSQDRSNPSSTLLFLKYIKSSSKSLKFLSLVGEFGINTHRTIDLDNLDGSWFKNIEEPSLSFDALKLISFDRLSLKALHKPEIFLKLKLQLPSLNASHMAPESENWKDANSLIFAEKSFIDWINSKLFPINMKKIFLEEKLLGADGKVMNFEGRKHEWEEARAELIDLCNEKGLEVIVLKEDEQREFERRILRV